MNTQSQRERITEYIKETYDTDPEYLWESDPKSAIFRHKGSKKWYALVMNISKEKLGLAESEHADVLNVKCDPLMLGSLLMENGFFPAYHMNKNSWVSVILDNSVPDDKICFLIGLSYNSVTPKRKRKA